MSATTRKPRAPSRPPLSAKVQAEPVDDLPANPGRRSPWKDFIAQARVLEEGRWLKVGPFYRDTAMSARSRYSGTPGYEDITVEIRHESDDLSYAYIQAALT